MKDLNKKELKELNGEGFAYDIGCTWRYIGHFTYGYLSSGGPFSFGAVVVGSSVAEATKCP